MEDTIYRVVTRYETDGSAAEAATESLAKKHSALASALASTASGLSGVFDRVASTVTHAAAGLGAAGLALGIGAVVNGITRLNAGAEEARVAIAGMMQASGASDNFQSALRVSDGLIERMRIHARTLPGEFQDLMNVFQGGLMGGLGAGKTSTQVEALSAQFMAVSQTMHVDSQTAGRELAMMLEGRSGSHIVMWSRLRSLVGKTSEEFNHMTQAQRFEAIERALHGFGDSIDEYGRSWSAVSSTAHDHLMDMLRVGTQPLFERAKNALQRLNEYFEDPAHNAQIMSWVHLIGDRLANAFDRVVSGAERLFNVIRHLNVHDVLGRVESGLGSAMATRAGLGLLSSPGTLGAVGGLVGGGALAGAGIIGAIAAPIAVAIGTGAVDLNRVFGRLRDAVGPVGEALKGLWIVLQPLLATIGVGLINTIVSLVQTLAPLVTGFVNLLGAVSMLVGWVLGVAGLGGSNGPRPGTQAAREHEMAVDQGLYGDNHTWLSAVTAEIGHQGRMNTALASGNTEAATILADGANLMADHLGDTLREHTQSLAHAINPGRQADEHRVQTHAQTPSGHMNVNVRIQQTINDASDPDRVLIQTRRAIQQAVRQPVESPNYVIHGR